VQTQYFMNKPKLIAIYKILDQKKDNLSKQTQVVEIFKVWDQALERSIRVNLPQSLIANLSEISTTFLRSFKERFLDKLIESLE
jgi:type III secretory pathway component EscT